MILKEKERTVIQDLQTQEKRAGALRFPEPGAFRYSSTGKL